jgi:glycolate oxidase
MTQGFIRELKKLIGPSAVLHLPEDVLLYEYDGSVEKGRPDIVAFPGNTEQVSRIVALDMTCPS